VPWRARPAAALVFTDRRPSAAPSPTSAARVTHRTVPCWEPHTPYRTALRCTAPAGIGRSSGRGRARYSRAGIRPSLWRPFYAAGGPLSHTVLVRLCSRPFTMIGSTSPTVCSSFAACRAPLRCLTMYTCTYARASDEHSPNARAARVRNHRVCKPATCAVRLAWHGAPERTQFRKCRYLPRSCACTVLRTVPYRDARRHDAHTPRALP
jgi:hypothetical protein